MAISKIGVQATGFADANVGLPIPNISLENRAAEAANGTIFFNTSNNAIEVYANGAWSGIGSAVVNPTITTINGDVSSGNTGSTLDIVGLDFDTGGVLVQGTLRFVYGGTTTDVTVTPNTATTIDAVSIPSAVLSKPVSTTGTIQFIRSDNKGSNIFSKNMTANEYISVTYVVVAGGAGGGSDRGGGGGAGGYLSGTLGILASPSTYTVTVGAGGSNGTYGVSRGFSGGNSVFASITSIGGGGGGSGMAGSTPSIISGGFGGSGGGSGSNPGATFGSGTPGQGNNGGSQGTNSACGGGGGAGGAGQTPPGSNGGAGGVGIASPITGTPVFRAGGGGGAAGPGTAGAGGPGGGGAGSGGDDSSKATAGTTNTGGGGGGGTGGGGSQNSGANGGSGVVLINYPSGKSLSNPGGGLTYTTGTLGDGSTLATFTAGTGSITLS